MTTSTSPVQGASARPRTISAQIAGMTVATMMVALCTFLATRVYAQRFPSPQVAALLLFRIYGMPLTAISILGMPLALLRNVSAARQQGAGRAPQRALVGISLGSVLLGITCALSVLFAARIAGFTGLPQAAGLWKAYALFLVAQNLANLTFYGLLGEDRSDAAALLTLLANGVSQLLPLAAERELSLQQIIAWTAVASFIFTLPFTAGIAVRALRHSGKSIRSDAGVLVSYGIPRMIGTLLEVSFDLAASALVLATGGTVLEAGYLAVGLSLLRPITPIASALNSILVPSSAHLAGTGQVDAHRTLTTKISEWSLHMGMFFAAQSALWCDAVVRYWLGPDFAGAIPVARGISLSLLALFAYHATRGLVDGTQQRAYNTYDLAAALAGFVLTALALRRFGGGMVAFALAYSGWKLVLGALTIYWAMRFHRAPLQSLTLFGPLMMCVVLGAAAWAIRLIPTSHPTLQLAISGPLLLALYLLSLGWMRIAWARSLLERSGIMSPRTA